MHGRVKVRSSEEKLAAERKEKAEKVRIYREVTSKIFTKRAAGDHDEETLKLTRDILVQNPDIATLWNYRREIVAPILSSSSVDEAVKACGVEQMLTQQCLRVNPKSYCVWLHRQWVMEHSPQPDWDAEKQLCNLFLKYDERNFHCWDYRRFVTAKAEVSLEDEFAFTYDKIAVNFSNYSAWHYRSKLLPLLHPSPVKKGGVAEEALLKEHELAQNAFFTDPSDQSAWLYHRWLLGKTEQVPAVSCVLVKQNPHPEAVVVLNQPIKVAQHVQVTVSGVHAYCSVPSDWPKSLWRFPLPDDVILSPEEDVSAIITFDELKEELLITAHQGGEEDAVCWLGGFGPAFASSLTDATTSVLTAELDSCKELLQMEPDNKWCILTVLLLLQALDSRNSHQQILDMFTKLSDVDPYRHGYYQDMRSRCVVEFSLAAIFQDGLTPSSPRTLDLSGKRLSRLYHSEYMLHLHLLDLSNNQLSSLHDLENLVCLDTLIVDDNKLQELPSGMEQLQLLRVLSIRNNKLCDTKQLHCVKVVKVLRLQGNPLCDTTGWKEAVRNQVQALQELNGHHLTS